MARRAPWTGHDEHGVPTLALDVVHGLREQAAAGSGEDVPGDDLVLPRRTPQDPAGLARGHVHQPGCDVTQYARGGLDPRVEGEVEWRRLGQEAHRGRTEPASLVEVEIDHCGRSPRCPADDAFDGL